MAKRSKTIDDVVDTALELAADRPWRDIRLNDIASSAGLTLNQLRALVPSKAGILKAFVERSDKILLSSLETKPVEGDVHDCLFDIIMRRLELIEPHKSAIANIVDAPADGATDGMALFGALSDSQGWTLAAAGIEGAGRQEAVKRHGLAMVTIRVLRVWAHDTDPGLAKTMASLDRALRDGATWLERLERPLAFGQAFANLAISIIQRNSRAEKPTEQPQPETKEN